MTSVTPQDNWPAWLSNDLNKIESKVVWQISFKACRASVLQLVAAKSWRRNFFPMLFLWKKKRKKKKNEARKWQWQMAMNRWDLATKKWEPKHHDVLCSKHFEKVLHRLHPAEHSVHIHVHRVTHFDKFPVRISKDEALTPLPVVGPLFISPLSFHLSRALLGTWRFCLFRSVYSSFHNRLDLIKEPAFYWVFYFILPNLSVFVSSYVKIKKFCSF